MKRCMQFNHACLEKITDRGDKDHQQGNGKLTWWERLPRNPGVINSEKMSAAIGKIKQKLEKL